MNRLLVKRSNVQTFFRGYRAGRSLAGLLLLAATLPTHAQVTQGVSGGTRPATAPAKPAMPTVAMTISPKAPEKPDLTYALLPKPEDTQKGNAAVKYYEGIASMPESLKDEAELIDTLLHAPLQDLDETAAASLVPRYGFALRFFHDGSRLESADWEDNIRREGMWGLLPSFGRLRVNSNALAVSIRLDIKHHCWTEARDKLQTGYGLARHLGQGEAVIESLVGIAIAGVMDKCVEDWIAQPDAPNLYWPLATLPTPFNDLRRPLAFERANVLFSFPELRQMREGQFPAEQWISFTNRFSDMTHIYDSGSVLGGNTLPSWQRQLTGVGFAIMQYPRAKEFLIARAVSPLKKSKNFLYLKYSAGISYAPTTKPRTICSNGLPCPIPKRSRGMPPQSVLLCRPPKPINSIRWPKCSSLPWACARLLAVRLDRQIALLSIIEDLRAYAAEKNAWPDSLDQVSLPVPLDPITGKPFSYERRGDAASLIAPSPDPNGYRYDLTLRRP